MKTLAIIPARGGSKGIPKKNLIPIGKKPLIQWTIEAALKSNFIDKIIVSSDDDEILEFASGFQEIITLKRPKNLSEDNTPTEPVILHALEELRVDANEYTHCILLQPTSPLRTYKHIDTAIELIYKLKNNSLISVCEIERSVLKCFVKNDDGYLEGIRNNQLPFLPRQSLPQVLKPNGAIFIFKTDFFVKNTSFWSSDCLPFIMDVEDSTDVDTMDDIQKIEKGFN